LAVEFVLCAVAIVAAWVVWAMVKPRPKARPYVEPYERNDED